MKLFIKLWSLAAIGVLLTACTIGNGRICGPQTPRAYCDKEAYEKLAHPKAYGEYFVKAGMSKESWRQDWMACGGMADGGYSAANASPGVDTTTLLDLTHRKVEKINACMLSKGYEFRREP